MRHLVVFLEVAVGLLMAVMTVVVSVQVMSRYLLNTPMDWTEEVSRISFGFLTFLGAATAIALGKQLKVDIVARALTGRRQHALRLFADILSLAFWGAVLVLSWPLLRSVHQMAIPVTQLPSSFPYAAVPVGALLIVTFLIRDAALQIRALVRTWAGDN